MITILSQIPNFKDRIIKLCEAASEAFERKSMRKL